MNKKFKKEDIDGVMSLTGLNFEESLEIYYLFEEKLKLYYNINGKKPFILLFRRGKDLLIDFNNKRSSSSLEDIIYYRFHNTKIDKNDNVVLTSYTDISKNLSISRTRCRDILELYKRRINKFIDLHFNYQSNNKYLNADISILKYYGAVRTNILRRHGINTIGDYMNMSVDERLELTNLGIIGVISIDEAIKNFKEFYEIS